MMQGQPCAMEIQVAGWSSPNLAPADTILCGRSGVLSLSEWRFKDKGCATPDITSFSQMWPNIQTGSNKL
jgi:hypothetical protein